MIRLILGVALGIVIHILAQEAANYSSTLRTKQCVRNQRSNNLEPYPYCWRVYSNQCTPTWEKIALYAPNWWDDLNKSSYPSDQIDGKCN